MEKIKWSEKVTNEKVLERIALKRTLLNNILCRKAVISEKKLIALLMMSLKDR